MTRAKRVGEEARKENLLDKERIMARRYFTNSGFGWNNGWGGGWNNGWNGNWRGSDWNWDRGDNWWWRRRRHHHHHRHFSNSDWD